MTTRLAVLLDGIVALVKLTTLSLDDAAAGAAKAGSKTIMVVIDDTTVTPQYAEGIDPRREIPIVGRIAKGSLVNKGIILVGVLLLSAFAPWALTPLLVAGGPYLCFEGAHKIWGKLTGHGEVWAAVMEGGQAEDAIVKNAVRADFILSTEIMVIALAEVTEQNTAYQAAILAATTALITVLVYGIVACLARIDDLGLHMVPKESSATRKMGQDLVRVIPKALSVIIVIGVAAVLRVDGHLFVSGSDRLGWFAPRNVVHSLSSAIPRGFFSWIIRTSYSLTVGFVFGSLIVVFQAAVGRIRGDSGH